MDFQEGIRIPSDKYEAAGSPSSDHPTKVGST
ncbi:uncharacterized protein G2W53_038360 [Senna tora]|uniref:Uncharacterized protein n=1 Tax=Senna tora TaxID=362788 RepID=A0A834SLM2_9FABA|nr:uncharacterized protein G2W53_038360 [Senna tora]